MLFSNLPAWLAVFTVKGLSLEEAEQLAERLTILDGDLDDRRRWLEFGHLKRSAGWRHEQQQRTDGFPYVRTSATDPKWTS